MAKSQETFSKKEKEKKRQKKKQEKQQKRDERRANAKEGGGLDDMIAYVDEYGNIVDTPPDPTKKKKIKAENIEVGVPKMVKEEEEAVKKGRVEFFNTAKGFGFIKELDSREKFFVHVNGLIDEIREGDVVSFELEQGLKGLNAVRVQRTK
ncbi:cold shock domain-containing protein [Flammeovirgaceae bacterium SG7u.111]|nr:cold shock domain-containing protein [Flammeovirgaceae bacterium SG7u.132]WPO38048.1 cold shock domain-containing protein [Flammeovirgaceae bacterium SG7u.111]